jgi:hypothetical protein
MVMWSYAGASAELASDGGGEVSRVVHADLAEDGLDVVAHGVARQEKEAAMSSLDRPSMIRAATSRSAGGEIPGGPRLVMV